MYPATVGDVMLIITNQPVYNPVSNYPVLIGRLESYLILSKEVEKLYGFSNSVEIQPGI